MKEPINSHNLDAGRNSGTPVAGGIAAWSGQMVPAPHPAFTALETGQSRDSESEPGGNGLARYWQVLLRNKWTLASGLALGLFAALGMSLFVARSYRARSVFEIQNVNSDFLNTRAINPIAEQPSNPTGTADIQTQLLVLQSDDLLDRVIEKLRAEHRLKALENDSRSHFVFGPPLSPAELNLALRERARNNLTVHQIGQTRAVEVLYKSGDPDFAAAFVQAFVAAYIDSSLASRVSLNESTGEYLERELDKAQAKLESSERALENYAKTSGLLYVTPSFGGTEKTNVAEQKLRELQESASKAQADLAVLQSRYEVAQSAPPDTLADVLNDPSLRSLQATLSELRRQRAELISIYTPKHEKVERIEVQIAALEYVFNNKRAAILASIRNDYEASLLRSQILEKDFGRQSGLVTQQAEKSIEYNQLKQQADSNRQVYNVMLEQVRSVGLATAVRPNNVQVIDPAQVPDKPYSPNLVVNAGLGVLIGLFASTGYTVLREHTNSTLREPGDARAWLNLPELGVVPSNSVDGKHRNYPQLLETDEAGRDRSAFLQPERSNGPIELAALAPGNNQPSRVAEAFRGVVTSLMSARRGPAHLRVLLITSTKPGEGKTSVTSNLAIGLAQIQLRVLVIDGDLRRPRLQDVFGVKNDLGLTSLLSPPVLDETAIAGAIQKTELPNLSLLTSGPPKTDPASLLYTRNLSKVLQRCRVDFDIVLIDSPPCIEMADARIIGRAADAVILVTRAGCTTREEAAAAKQRFHEDQIPVLGAILNDWDPKKYPNAYYPSTEHRSDLLRKVSA